MENETKLPFDALTKGYVLLPKFMLESLLQTPRKRTSELEAFFVVLTRVNYKEETCVMRGKSLCCPRGESLKSLRSWAELLGWTKGQTRHYFRKLQRMGLLEIVPEELTTHIRVKEYELWTGNGLKKRKDEGGEEAFDRFWKHYHEVTQTNRVNIGRARRVWKRLTDKERERAEEQVEEYYVNLKNTAFCMQAASYLADKAFMNEYEE